MCRRRKAPQHLLFARQFENEREFLANVAGQVLVRDAICAVVTFGFYFGAFVLAALESPSVAVLALSNRCFPAMIVQASVIESGDILPTAPTAPH